jgi:hypothetical protein
MGPSPLILFACRREQHTIQEKIYEAWKLEILPAQRISQGMRVEIQSYGGISPIEGAVVIVREGIIGKRTHWERRWAEYELIMGKKGGLSVTLLVPIEWLRMNLLDRIRHYRERRVLPDITPGPYPRYEKGEAQRERRLK